MSQAIADFERSENAGEAMTDKQYFIVQQAADGDIELGESATDLLVGILQNKPAADEPALYRFLGTSKVVAAAAISIGDWVTTDSAGKAVATTTNLQIVIGRALEAAGADGDIIEIQLGIFTLST